MAGKTSKKRWLPNLRHALDLLLLALALFGCQINSKAPTVGVSQPAASTTGAVLIHANKTEKGNELVLRQGSEKVQAQRNDSLMPGLFILPSQRVVSVSSLNLQPGKENPILIRWSNFTLAPLNIDKLTLVEYDMPTMPEMGGPFTAPLVKKSAFETEATLDIAHGGYWEMKMTFDDGTKETVKIGIEIPRGRR